MRVDVIGEPGAKQLRVVIPPATPAGEYIVDVAGRDVGERALSATLRVTVDAMTVSAAGTVARVPVVLLNGFQLFCTDTDSTLAASVGTFGQLASLLQADGAPVVFFNNCSYGDISIEQLASQLNAWLASAQYTDGTPVTQVDLVAHSMGGLIARAYLSGKRSVSGSFAPPANHKVHKLITIATPHFGSFQASNIGVQESAMVLGSQFLWDLATWNQGQDDLRGVDALAVIGNAGTYGSTNNASDGVVSLTSGSLNFARADQRTRIVPYCHTTPGFLTGLGMSCVNHQGIADINDPSHLTAQIVHSFLADTSAWQSIGAPPSQDPFLFLRFYGGTFLALKGTNDVYFRDLTSVQFDSGAGQLISGPSNAIASIFYTEWAAGGQHNFVMNHSAGYATTDTGPISVGGAGALLFKYGPRISSVQSTTSTGLPGLTVASGSTIVVRGVGFGNTTATQLSANGALLSVSQISDQQITAYLPSSYSGLVGFMVANTNGWHSVNVMTAQAAGPPGVSSLSPSQIAAGSAGFTLQVTGINFVSGEVVQWNGSNRTTAFVSSTSLTAAIPASDLVSAGMAAVTVVNPGASSSNALFFAILSAPGTNSVVPASAQVRYVPHLASGAGFVTKLTITNMVAAQNNVVVNFISQGGTLQSSTNYVLAPGATQRIETPESSRFLASSVQWAMVGSDQSVGINTFFELTGSGGLPNVINTIGFNDAVPAISQQLPVEFQPKPANASVGRTVGLALANTSPSAGTAILTLLNSNGTSLASAPVNLSGYSQTSIELTSLSALSAVLPAGNFVGQLSIASNTPMVAIALGDDFGPFFSTPPVSVGRTGQIIIPHIPSGGGFVTKLTFMDRSGAAQAVDVKFYDQSGNLIQNQTVNLAANGTARISTPEAARFGASQVSWAMVTAPGTATVNLFYELQDSSTVVVNTIGFNDVPTATDFTIPVEFLPAPQGASIGRTVGLAMANPGNVTASITLKLVDASGQVLATAPVTLNPHAQTAVSLADLAAFRAALPDTNFVGVVTVNSSAPISAIALGDDFGPFYATPVIAGRAR